MDVLLASCYEDGVELVVILNEPLLIATALLLSVVSDPRRLTQHVEVFVALTLASGSSGQSSEAWRSIRLMTRVTPYSALLMSARTVVRGEEGQFFLQMQRAKLSSLNLHFVLSFSVAANACRRVGFGPVAASRRCYVHHLFLFFFVGYRWVLVYRLTQNAAVDCIIAAGELKVRATLGRFVLLVTHRG